MSERNAFEVHPKLARYMEQLANLEIPGWSLQDWQVFTDSVNAAVTGWRPIASAPKDQPIIGWWNGYKRPCVMWWNLIDKAFESYADRNEDPSHWMPIPTPPESQS